MKMLRLSLPLLLCLAAMICAPVVVVSAQPEPSLRVFAANEGVVGKGENGFDAQFKVGSISTGSTKLYVATGVVPPDSETPPHLHEVDEEVLYVLEGEITLMLGDEVHTLRAGGTAFIPPGTWMQVSNKSTQPARVLGILSRGEVERCFRALYMPADYPRDPAVREQDFATCKTQLGDTGSDHPRH